MDSRSTACFLVGEASIGLNEQQGHAVLAQRLALAASDMRIIGVREIRWLSEYRGSLKIMN